MADQKSDKCICGVCTQELQALTAQVEKLNSHRYLQILDSTYKMLCWSFLQGIAPGFGTVIGATLVVTIIASVLSALDWIPMLGEWFDGISNELKLSQ